jgi:RNA polymerase sigma factor (sigma-70 family)
MRCDRLQSREPSPVEAAIASELNEIVTKILKNLPWKHRRVLELRYYKHLSFQEISSLHSMAAERVRSIEAHAISKLNHRARRTLVLRALSLSEHIAFGHQS